MCTLEKRGSLFILTLTGPGEHRLNPTLLDSIHSALRRVRSESATSSALITTSQGKFFSNGYDLAWAHASPPAAVLSNLQLMSSKLRSVVADLISLPMPTIAAVNGHASAGGFILALSHDYILMRKDRGFLYMSELNIGLVIPAWFFSLINCKIGNPVVRREVIMTAAKLTAEQAVEWGIVDSAHDSAEETMREAERLGEELVGKKWEGHVYGQNRMRLLREALEKIETGETVEEVRSIVSRL